MRTTEPWAQASASLTMEESGLAERQDTALSLLLRAFWKVRFSDPVAQEYPSLPLPTAIPRLHGSTR